MTPPFPDNCDSIVVGMGCFWGAERKFWQLPGVYTTAVGYAGGYTPNPTYEETCSGLTGHTEVVLVVWDRTQTDLDAVLRCFWENHDPTQGHRQGNDIGTQYRSAIFFQNEAQKAAAEQVIATVNASGQWGMPVVTQLEAFQAFYPAEDKHQKYIMQFPDGYTCHHRRNFDLGETP